MWLPKSHTPHKVTKKTEFKKYVNESTSQRVNKSTSFWGGSVGQVGRVRQVRQVRRIRWENTLFNHQKAMVSS